MTLESNANSDGSEDAGVDTPAASNETIMRAQDGVIVLPADVSLESLDVDGRDLVITLSDGSRIIVPDGAIVVPQIVAEGVAVPPQTVAQLLTGGEPEPAAGATQSSGGNFAADEGAIQDAFDIGDLLPFTELAFPEFPEEEIIPAVPDEEPEVIIETPDNPAGVENAIATVDEDGLPVRGDEPQGTREETDSETTAGTIVFVAEDGLSAILINGVEITTVGQEFTSPFGTLTITSINLASGEIGFSYTLEDNTLGVEEDGFFEVTVIDTDGDVANASLSVLIVDDSPIAADDIGIVPAGSHAPITGDVLANDEPGADDYDPDGAVLSFSKGGTTADPGDTLQGEFGTLTLNADGTYTYTRDINTPGGVEESFDYTIVDADGSTASATLTIQIENALDTITEVPRVGEGTVVNESALPPRGDEPVGSSEGLDGDPDNDSDPTENTGATITFNSPDGVESVTLNGVAITPGSLPQTVLDDETGTLIVTGYTYDPVTGDGTITYEYTLADNTSGDDTTVEVDILVTDLDGDVADDTLVIRIVDDEPEAEDDAEAQEDENAPVTIDVLGNDTAGADDVDPSTVTLVEGTLSGTGTLVNNGDGTFTYTPGKGEEGEVTFDYTIVDGDGDEAEATATIELLPDSKPEGGETVATVDDDGLTGGNSASTIGDLDANIGDDPVDTSEASFTGVLPFNVFNDTPASISFDPALNGSTASIGAETVTYSVSGNVLTATVTGGDRDGTDLFSVEITDTATGAYKVTLLANVLHQDGNDENNAFASIDFVVTDSDDSTALTNLTIVLNDDAPTASDDAGEVAEGQYGPISGNVLTNDAQGADGAQVTSYRGAQGEGVAGAVIQGLYGKLTIAADGTYSYTRGPGTPGGVTDAFSYTITDADGDTASASLVITIADGDTDLDLPVAGEDGTQVFEAGLDGPPAGSDATSDRETTTGTFTFSAEDGPATVLIDGVAVTGAGQTFTGTHGTLEILAVNDGSISYSYTLTTNTTGDTTSDSFVVRVEDQDDDFSESTLEIAIVDDVPDAKPDEDSVTEDGPLIADGNVLTGAGGVDANASDGVADVEGADDATVTGVAFGDIGADVAGDVGTGVAGNYGSLTINPDGSYSYALDNANETVQGLDKNESLTETFTYTITDGDGDTSTTTVKITINGADDPVEIDGLDLQVPELAFYEDDLPDGSSPNATALTKTGTFSLTSQDGLVTLTVGGVTVFDANASTTYPVTIDDPAYGILTITGVATTTDADGDVVAATISYSYTLDDNSLLHTGGDDASFTDSFEVVATDSDNSSDSAFLDIEIFDDVPDAEDDVASQDNENQAFEIDALINDEFGADGVDTTNAAKVFVSTQAAQGTVTYDTTTGKFTYTPDPDAGSGGNVSDFFEYTIIDADGDVSTARVDITLQPDSEPSGGERIALLDDDGLAGGNDLSTTGDLNANLGDLLADNNETTYSGILSFNVGNDTPAEIGFDPALNGSTDTVGQETVTYSVVGNILTATVTGGDRDGTDLFTVEIVDPATGEYLVTLLDNVVHDAGSDENNASVSFDFVVSDSEDDTALTNLTIVFDDDAPTASDNSNTVDEGSFVTGNLLTDDDGDGVDASGADGYGADGAVIELTSVTFGGSTTTLDPSGDLVIATTLGTLTVDPVTGEYTYVSNSNSTNADAVDVFTYTIVDGDGDETTATLTIDVTNAPGQVSDNDVLVNEAGLADGSSPLDGSQIDNDGQISVVGATGTLVYSLSGAVAGPGPNEVQIDGSFGTIVLNTTTGKYTYTLDTPFTDTVDENGANTVNGAESFTYEVRDTLGNLIGGGTISVSIVDDIPTATDQANINVAEDAPAAIGGNVMTDGTPDTEGADGATVTAIIVDGNEVPVPQNGSSATVITAKGTYAIDMDGNWTFDPNPNQDHSGGNISADFSYKLTDSDGDFDTAVQPITITDGADPAAGDDISLELDDQNLSDGSTPGATTDSDAIVFTEGSDDIVSIKFDDSLTALDNLGGGLTWSRVSDTQITGSDNGRLVVTLDLVVNLATNTATVTATLNDNYDDHPIANDDDIADLGDVDVVATDVDGDTASATVSVSVSDDLPSITAGTPAADALMVDETDLSINATANFSTLFTSDANADGPGTVGEYTLGINPGSTGLIDTATNQAVVLTLESGAVVGRNGDGDVVFTVTVDANGMVTLDQQRAVKHGDTNDDNEPETLDAANLITLSATIKDSDGDTDTATANIAGAITFRDDGPSLSDVTLGSSVTVDETGGLTSATSLASIISFTADYGEDGDNGATFALIITDASSGLATAVGDYPITLEQTSATVITGVFDNGSGDQPAFTVTINADGTITLTQLVALEHLNPSDDNDPLDLDGKISASVTIKDGDNDTDTATIPVGGALTFLDDGPAVELSGINDSLTASDADFGTDPSTNFADNFTFTGGTDGQASTSFALSTVDETDSGLIDTQTGNAVFLFLEGGAVVGREGVDATAAASGAEVFRVTVDSNGNVTLDQSRAINHVLSDGADGTSVSLDDAAIQLIGTVFDNDGDSASIPLNIGANLSFTDDVPSADDNEIVLLDDDTLADGNPGGPNDDPDAAFTSGVLNHDFGNDGGSIAFSTGGAPTGFRYVASGSDILIQQDQGSGFVTVVTVTLNPATGAYTVQQNLSILHETGDTENNVEFTLSYTVTDGDTDSDTGTLVINVDDDTPTATDDGEIATVDDNVVDENIGTVADLTGNDSYGADGEGSPAITIATGTLGGSVTIDGSGNLLYTSATNIVAPFADQVETFTYTIRDGDGDTTTATFQVRLTDEGPAINADAASFTVDEEGLGGIAGNGDSSGDAPGEATVQTGNLLGIDFGADGPGAITLTAVADTGLVTLAGNAVRTVWDGTTLTGEDAVTGDDVFTLTITDVTTGAYEFELLAPVKHPDGTTEDDQTLTIEVIVSDAENETASGTITVTIDDDSPVANDDTNALGEDTSSVSGNVLTDPTADNFGADGAGSPAITGISGSGSSGVIGDTINGTFGSLVVGANGAYTYTLNTTLVQGLDDGDTETDTFSYIIKDADGDTSIATLTITINGANDAPVAIADTNWTIEDATSAITGNVLQDVDHPNAPSGSFADVADTDVDAEPLTVTTVGTFIGTYGTLTLNADGSYSYELDNSNPAVQALNAGDTPLTDTFAYTATDGDLSDSSTLTISIFGTNDAPVVGTATVATSDEGLTGGLADTAGTSDTTDLRIANGTISITDVDDTAFTVTLGVPAQSIAVADGTVSGAAVTWSLSTDGKTLTGTINGGTQTAITVVIDDTGAFIVTQSLPIFHSDTSVEDFTFFTVDVSVNDGTTTVTQANAITVNLEDDSPVAVAPDPITVTNAAGPASSPVALDTDSNIANNVGGDGGTVRFPDSLDGADSGLTASFVPITYVLDDAQTLRGVADGTTIFTITLDPANGTYTVDMDGTIDSVTTIDFNDGGYNFTGGNFDWNGFVPVGEELGGTVTDNDSPDLLLTPAVSGNPDSTVNTTANIGGIGGGASVGSSETFRVDFVTDLRGDQRSTGGGDYDTASKRDHEFDGHYTVNGASALFKSTGGSTVNIAIFDDPDGNNVVGDGAQDTITGVSIIWRGQQLTGSGGEHIIIPTTTPTSYSVGGQTFTITLMPDGSVNISGIEGDTGSSLIGTVIAVFSDDGFNSVEYTYVSGDTFQIGDFGATTLSTDPVNFSVPVEVVDNDGDVSAQATIDITATTPTSSSSSAAFTPTAFSTTQVLLDEPILAGDEDPGSGGGSGTGSGTEPVVFAANVDLLKYDFRMSEIAMVAALSGALLIGESAFDAITPAGVQSNTAIYDLVPVEFAEIAPLPFAAEALDSTWLLGSFEAGFTATNGVAEWGGLNAEAGMLAPAELTLGLQSEPRYLEPYQSDADGIGLGANSVFFATQTPQIDQAMEALLTMQPDAVSVGDNAAIDAMADAASSILTEIGAELSLEKLIEGLAEDAGSDRYLVAEVGELDVGIIDQMLEGYQYSGAAPHMTDAHIDEVTATTVSA